MIGVPYNPENCAFITNQALNSNQFNGNVPNSSNLSNHTILWDFIEEKLYWVNTLTNIIEREFPSGSGGANEVYSAYTGFDSVYLANLTAQVFGNNFLQLDAGTYNFELEWDIKQSQDGNPPSDEGVVVAEIRTNTNPSSTGVNVGDVVQNQRISKLANGLIKVGSPGVLINQNVCKNNVTFNSPFVVKSVFYCLNSPEGQFFTQRGMGRIFLRALKVK